MADSIVSICNRGLALIKDEYRIISLTEDSEPARLCNLHWSATRDAVLRAHPWNCAIKRTSLAQDATPPAYGYDYRYAVPSDLLRLLEVVNSSEYEEEYEVESGYIVTDSTSCLIKYVYRLEDPKKYDSLLSEAMSRRIAAQLAYPRTGFISVAQSMFEMYESAISEARGVDAREGRTQTVNISGWYSAKFGG